MVYYTALDMFKKLDLADFLNTLKFFLMSCLKIDSHWRKCHIIVVQLFHHTFSFLRNLDPAIKVLKFIPLAFFKTRHTALPKFKT